MPRSSSRDARPAEGQRFQVGDYWLSQQARSDVWCRTWYDADARQTKRASLGTKDFREAKERLTDWFVAQHRPENADLSLITLAQVLQIYWDDHAQHLA